MTRIHRIKQFKPELTGLGVFAWILSFPFYGPLSATLLKDYALWGTHSFSLGLAVGSIILSVLIKKTNLPVHMLASGSCGLALLALLSPSLNITMLLMWLSGFLAAAPVLAWVKLLSTLANPVNSFIIPIILVNLWCFLSTFPASGHWILIPWTGFGAAGFIAASFPLRHHPAPKKAEAPNLPWQTFFPLALFIISTSSVCGLLYRTFMPELSDWPGIGWLSFWPYMAGLVLAGFLAYRRYQLLAVMSLSILGLALLGLAADYPPMDLTVNLVSYAGTLAGSAFADAFIWLSLIYLASRGFSRLPGLGLGLNVLTIWTIGVLYDLVSFSSHINISITALLGAAFLFVMIPFILPRVLPTEPDWISPEQFDPIPCTATDPEELSTLTETETKVYKLILEGKKNREIADELFISLNTVKFHVRNILRKYECSSRKELIKKQLPHN